MMHLWDAALMRVLPNYYESDASPQTLYRIKKDIIRVMQDEHHLPMSADEIRHVRVEWLADEQSVNLRIPPSLLRKTIH